MQIKVFVKPNSKKGPLLLRSKDRLYIAYVAEPPVDGKATEAVISLLADHFKVSKTSVTLVAGAKAKLKIFKIGK